MNIINYKGLQSRLNAEEIEEKGPYSPEVLSIVEQLNTLKKKVVISSDKVFVPVESGAVTIDAQLYLEAQNKVVNGINVLVYGDDYYLMDDNYQFVKYIAPDVYQLTINSGEFKSLGTLGLKTKDMTGRVTDRTLDIMSSLSNQFIINNVASFLIYDSSSDMLEFKVNGLNLTIDYFDNDNYYKLLSDTEVNDFHHLS